MLRIAQTAAAREAGVPRDDKGMLYLPFTVDTETLAAESPTMDKTLAPLDAALDKLLKVHLWFDAP